MWWQCTKDQWFSHTSLLTKSTNRPALNEVWSDSAPCSSGLEMDSDFSAYRRHTCSSRLKLKSIFLAERTRVTDDRAFFRDVTLAMTNSTETHTVDGSASSLARSWRRAFSSSTIFVIIMKATVLRSRESGGHNNAGIFYGAVLTQTFFSFFSSLVYSGDIKFLMFNQTGIQAVRIMTWLKTSDVFLHLKSLDAQG